jgi:site-specific DNA-adenine methylase
MKMSSVLRQKKNLKEMETKEVITILNRMTVEKLRQATVEHNMSEMVGLHKNMHDAKEEALRKEAAALNTAARILSTM